DNARKPVFAIFTAAARALDFRSPIVFIKPNQSNPAVRVPVWELEARDGAGAKLGSTISVTYRGRSVGVSQPTSTIAVDGYAFFRVPVTKAKKNGLYIVSFKIRDVNGNRINRVAQIVVLSTEHWYVDSPRGPSP